MFPATEKVTPHTRQWLHKTAWRASTGWVTVIWGRHKSCAGVERMEQAHICSPLGGTHGLIIRGKLDKQGWVQQLLCVCWWGLILTLEVKRKEGPGWLRAAKSKQGGWKQPEGNAWEMFYRSSYELSKISEGGTNCLVRKRGGNKTWWGQSKREWEGSLKLKSPSVRNFKLTLFSVSCYLTGFKTSQQPRIFTTINLP